jgi:hypothetical protein
MRAVPVTEPSALGVQRLLGLARVCLVPEPDDFMTVAEVAAILKLNQQTVRN